MKRQALEQVVEQHVLTIKKHCDQVPGSFAVEDIHDLRVEYKKARAFLRLLQLERDAGDLQMPEKLKALYKSAGAVRDLQLFLISIPAVPVFMQAKQRQLFQCKEQLVRAIEDTRFKKEMSAIEKELPDQLQDSTIQKFNLQKIAAIHIILLAAEEEKDLHDVRKNVKDIIYTNKFFGIVDESMNNTATQLGNFNDRCIALSLLEDRENLPAEETAILDKLHAAWQQEKDAMQMQLLHQMQQLQINAKT